MDILRSLVETLTLGSRSSEVEDRDPPLTMTLLVDIGTPPPSSSTLKFRSHVKQGEFGITSDLSYSEESGIPKMIPASRQKRLLGKNLGDGFNSAVRIEKYSELKVKKIEFFFKWLENKGYFRRKKAKRADFICFGGRIADPLQTPLVTLGGDWELYAAKVKDSIFLWGGRGKKGDWNQSRERDILSFHGIAFEALMTGRDPLTVNEFEKGFVIQQAFFGEHRLLLLNEIDGKDKKGFVEFKVFSKATQGKYLKNWAQSVVAGVRQIFLGKRENDGNGRLLSITRMTLEETLARGKFGPEHVQKAYDFEDRLLCWISSHFAGRKNDPTFVKKFSWDGAGNTHVICERVEKGEKEWKEFFPEWFLKT